MTHYLGQGPPRCTLCDAVADILHAGGVWVCGPCYQAERPRFAALATAVDAEDPA